jgi:hypothetical protein
MKSFLTLLSVSVLLLSCTKEAVAPQGAPQLFYKDGNIAVQSMQATEVNASTVKVSFATLYENNVQKIEVMSGNTPNLLCTIDELDFSGNSAKLTNYSVNDKSLKGSVMYYMLRYTLNSGDWGYTPVVSVSIK